MTNYRSLITEYWLLKTGYWLLKVSEPFQPVPLPAPVLGDLDFCFQENPGLEKFFHTLSGLRSNFFQRASRLTDDDAFLRIALNEYFRAHMEYAVLLFEVGDHYLGAIGNFLFIIKEYFFAKYFRSKETLRAVS